MWLNALREIGCTDKDIKTRPGKAALRSSDKASPVRAKDKASPVRAKDKASPVRAKDKASPVRAKDVAAKPRTVEDPDKVTEQLAKECLLQQRYEPGCYRVWPPQLVGGREPSEEILRLHQSAFDRAQSIADPDLYIPLWKRVPGLSQKGIKKNVVLETVSTGPGISCTSGLSTSVANITSASPKVGINRTSGDVGASGQDSEVALPVINNETPGYNRSKDVCFSDIHDPNEKMEGYPPGGQECVEEDQLIFGDYGVCERQISNSSSVASEEFDEIAFYPNPDHKNNFPDHIDYKNMCELKRLNRKPLHTLREVVTLGYILDYYEKEHREDQADMEKAYDKKELERPRVNHALQSDYKIRIVDASKVTEAELLSLELYHGSNSEPRDLKTVSEEFLDKLRCNYHCDYLDVFQKECGDPDEYEALHPEKAVMSTVLYRVGRVLDQGKTVDDLPENAKPYIFGLIDWPEDLVEDDEGLAAWLTRPEDTEQAMQDLQREDDEERRRAFSAAVNEDGSSQEAKFDVAEDVAAQAEAELSDESDDDESDLLSTPGGVAQQADECPSPFGAGPNPPPLRGERSGPEANSNNTTRPPPRVDYTAVAREFRGEPPQTNKFSGIGGAQVPHHTEEYSPWTPPFLLEWLRSWPLESFKPFEPARQIPLDMDVDSIARHLTPTQANQILQACEHPSTRWKPGARAKALDVYFAWSERAKGGYKTDQRIAEDLLQGSVPVISFFKAEWFKDPNFDFSVASAEMFAAAEQAKIDAEIILGIGGRNFAEDLRAYYQTGQSLEEGRKFHNRFWDIKRIEEANWNLHEQNYADRRRARREDFRSVHPIRLDDRCRDRMRGIMIRRQLTYCDGTKVLADMRRLDRMCERCQRFGCFGVTKEQAEYRERQSLLPYLEDLSINEPPSPRDQNKGRAANELPQETEDACRESGGRADDSTLAGTDNAVEEDVRRKRLVEPQPEAKEDVVIDLYILDPIQRALSMELETRLRAYNQRMLIRKLQEPPVKQRMYTVLPQVSNHDPVGEDWDEARQCYVARRAEKNARYPL